MTSVKLKKITGKHRGVDPIIAALLLVAITVTGGSVVSVFTQEFYNVAQLSGAPTIELIKILGYDARDVTELTAHDGVIMPLGSAGDPTSVGKHEDERIAVYLKNDSVNQVHLIEVRLGGTVYSYDTSAALTDWDSITDLVQGEYSVLTNPTSILQEQAAILNPGQTATILIDLDDAFPFGRDVQFKLTTTNGAIFVSTVIMGFGTVAPSDLGYVGDDGNDDCDDDDDDDDDCDDDDD